MEYKITGFDKWIKNFEQVHLPIGDLAKDIALDKKFPKLSKNEESRQIGIDYLNSKGACWGALKAFKNAFDFYINS